MESIILEKLGTYCLRIFRILRDKKLMEQKQVSEYAMIPIKETRDALYKMLKAGFVKIQEVAKSPEYHPNRSYYLWYADMSEIVKMLENERFKCILNLLTAGIEHDRIAATINKLAMFEL